MPLVSPENTSSTRVCIISHDVVGERMAGPGIRYVEMARVLSAFYRVILAVPNQISVLGSVPFSVYAYDSWSTLAPLVTGQDVVVFASDIAHRYPQLAEIDAALVVDGYDPLLAEWLAISVNYSDAERKAWWPDRMRQLTTQYLIGDFFLCASERQRDWWIGLLEANGRINPQTFHDDPSLRRLVDVVPFGLPDSQPQWIQPVIKDVWPGIHAQDKVVLWGGGLWPWLDPHTAILAMVKVCKERDDVKLVFPGTRHPNPGMSNMPTQVASAMSLAEQWRVRDKAVFFGDWIPYALWPSALLECDIAITLHFDTLETHLAFRTRLLDYIWAGLPMIATAGDETSRLVSHYHLGQVVDCQDVDSVANAILLFAQDEAIPGQRFSEARAKLNWTSVLHPLIRFCADPQRSPDRSHNAMLSGNPFYESEHLFSQVHFLQRQVDTLQRELEQLRAEQRALLESSQRLSSLVHAYENGRFMRVMRSLAEWRSRLHL